MSIRCMLIEPHKKAEVIYLEDTEYKTLRDIIGGIIGRTPVAEMPGLYILVDDECLYKEGLEFNRKVFNYLFYGVMLIVAEDTFEEDPDGYISLTDEQVAWVIENMGSPPDESEIPTQEDKEKYIVGSSFVIPFDF